ncbi:MAG: peptidoglycan editing factor PgeF [Treponema sp.]|nr:peptidoglycan editing factor PgeF [Treponema sp.]
MTITKQNSVEFLVFKNLSDTGIVKHCFSTRKGGVSSGAFASMNLGYNRGDDDTNVDENFRRICEAAGLSNKEIVMSKQKHGTNIMEIKEICDVSGSFTRSGSLEVPDNTDGLITNHPNIVLATFYADCVPILLCDPVKRVIANSHAGWRGCVDNMAALTVKKMTALYGSNPSDILAGIGPCICGSCFEVDEDVAVQFKNEFGDCVLKAENKPGKFYIDLRETCKLSLLGEKIPIENIEIAPCCTYENPDLFFSHRRDNALRGSLAAFIELI